MLRRSGRALSSHADGAGRASHPEPKGDHTMDMLLSNRPKPESQDVQTVAGNGLLDRRAFLRGGTAIAAAMSSYGLSRSAAAERLVDDAWSTVPGSTSRPYEQRSRFEEKIGRTLSNPNGEPRTQHARTPHHLLQGMITP